MYKSPIRNPMLSPIEHTKIKSLLNSSFFSTNSIVVCSCCHCISCVLYSAWLNLFPVSNWSAYFPSINSLTLIWAFVYHCHIIVLLHKLMYCPKGQHHKSKYTNLYHTRVC